METVNMIIGYAMNIHIGLVLLVWVLLLVDAIVCWGRGYDKDEVAGSFVLMVFGAIPLANIPIIVWLIMDIKREIRRRI